MDRRRPSSATLVAAAIAVVTSLAALVVLPLVVSERTERYRSDNEQHAEPARAALNEISYRLSQQIAALTRAVATRNGQDVGAYRDAVHSQNEALGLLEQHAGVLGPQYDAGLAELQHRLNLWHSSVEQSVDAERLAFDTNYPAVIEALHRLDEAITGFQSARRYHIRRLARIQMWLTVGLVLLASIAALIVLWIITRLRLLANVLAQESEARQAALERERELVRSRDEILGVVSHDLRNPLTTIALSAQLMKGSSADEHDEQVEMILSTTRRMERLIQDLLDVTRIENGRLSVKRMPVDPGAVARDVAASHAAIASSKGIDFQSSIDEGLPQISGDPDRLEQALSNLIGNAMKFTPSGENVRLSVSSHSGNVRFDVYDSGPGIAPTDLPHIFDPFFQAKKTAHLGAGLGLKITRAIVEAHDGSIEAKNNPSGGACFTVDIPAAPPVATKP